MTNCKYTNDDYCEYIDGWCPYIVLWKSGHGNYPDNNICSIYENGTYNIDVAHELIDLHTSEIFRDLYSESMRNLARKNNILSSSLYRAMPSNSYILQEDLIQRAKSIEIRDQFKENKGFWKWLLP